MLEQWKAVARILWISSIAMVVLTVVGWNKFTSDARWAAVIMCSLAFGMAIHALSRIHWWSGFAERRDDTDRISK